MAQAKTYPPIVLGFFARGLNTNRQPLFSALTGVGLQVIQFKDYLIDGVNVECTDRFTLQRAPGFVKYCSQQLASSEKVLQFYDTRDLSGNVYTLADTNQNLYTVTPSALTSLLTKGTANQGFTQQIGGVTYYANGTDLKKWLPPAASMVPWGCPGPLTAPAIINLNISQNGLIQFWLSGTILGSPALLDSNGNIQYSASGGTTNPVGIPIWATQLSSTTLDGNVTWKNVGPLGTWIASNAFENPSVIVDSNSNIQLVTTAGTSGATVPSWNATFAATTTDGTITWTNIGQGNIAAYSGFSYIAAYRTVSGNLSTAGPPIGTGPIIAPAMSPVSISAWSITSTIATFTAANGLRSGQQLILSGFPTSTFFNGLGIQVLNTGLSTTQFTANVVHANGSGTEVGLATPVLLQLTSAGSTNPECNSSATVSSVAVLNGVATITAANNFSPGINIKFSGLTGAAFLNSLILPVSSATPTSFTVSVPKQANYGPTADSGSAIFQAVEIYRTQDGGGVYYFDGATFNTASVWVFTDQATDSQLATSLVCQPGFTHSNDPPPGQVGSTQPLGGTILAWWQNRIWMAVGNLLYFSGGPDILNGIPEECWPPANVFVFPGVITSLNPTTGGLVVVIPEEVWAILGGPQTTTFYPEKIFAKFGALSPNCVKQDGDTLFVYSSQQQLTVLSGSGKAELGAGGSGVCPVGDLLANGTTTLSVTASAWSPTASYLTIHRQGEDSGIYLSNGVESIIRYGANVNNFSPVRQPLVTGSASAGAINSVETSAGKYSLLMNPNVAHDYIYTRSLTTFADNGNAYASNAVIGNIVVTEPGQPLAPLQFIAAYFYNRGSIPAVSFFHNDIAPAAFVALSTVQAEPAFLPAPAGLMSKRWPVMMNQTGTAILVRHLQVKMDFGNTDTVKNELIEMTLRFDTEQMG